MTDGPVNQNTTPPRSNSRTIFYVLLLLILFGINVYLYIKYNQRTTQSQQLTEQVNDDSTRLSDLNMKYQEALVNIESYKGQNAQLDSIIAVKEKSLLDLKNNYAAQAKKNKITQAEYDKQVAGLNSIVSDLQNQIIQLQQQNQVLITRNDSLGQSLAQEINTSTQLKSTNATLSKKVNIASLLKPTSITFSGVRVKSSGKEDETTNAKKAGKLKVCWEIPENDVADAGEKTFYVRIIGPDGITLALESSGSGVMNSADDNSPIQYTISNTVNYDQKATNACAYWTQSAPFGKGSYTVNIYQDGYMIGTQKLVLK
ncbi:MAG TPA: hypothetical protein VE978_25350 [Chitinophagales bacterium]|nr:hypothetical protein [Chitinophagales bacterium]